MRQLIIARKDLQMSPGKLAAQCCHASLAFLTDPIGMGQSVKPIEKDGEITGYRAEIMLEKATYEEWFDGSFTKTICGAKNRNQLLKAKTIAEELGLVENKDFFLIRDACHTELEPEEFDENGEGMTLTCIASARCRMKLHTRSAISSICIDRTPLFYKHFPQSLQPLQINLLPQVSQFARKWGT